MAPCGRRIAVAEEVRAQRLAEFDVPGTTFHIQLSRQLFVWVGAMPDQYICMHFRL
jgi:hypothetical protein